MKRSIVVVVSAVSLVACSEDVYVAPPSTGTTSEPLECAIAPGEDVCSRDVSAVPVESRTQYLGAVSAIAELAGTARAGVEAVGGVCAAIATKTGEPVAAATTPKAKASAACDAALRALARVPATAIAVEIRSGACVSSPAPACAKRSEPRTSCDAIVTVTVASAADETATRAADALRESFAAVVTWKDRLGGLAALVGDVSSDAGVVAAGPAKCTPAIVRLASSGVDEINETTRLVGALYAAVVRP